MPQPVDDRQLWLVVVLVGALLLPFVNRAFHIDDPLFLWAAKQIQTHPADPYGFRVNWYGADMAMFDVTKNPPLASYYLALVASIAGWSERALHLALMLPALSVVAGMFLLARRWCMNPALAVLAGLLTPVFLVSAVTVMCDVLMLAFFVWAVYAWTTGLAARSHAWMALAGALMAAAALTKYFGIALIPLLLVYALVKERRVGVWLLHFLIPIAALIWYQSVTLRLYRARSAPRCRGVRPDHDGSREALTRQDIRDAGVYWRLRGHVGGYGGAIVVAQSPARRSGVRRRGDDHDGGSGRDRTLQAAR